MVMIRDANLMRSILLDVAAGKSHPMWDCKAAYHARLLCDEKLIEHAGSGLVATEAGRKLAAMIQDQAAWDTARSRSIGFSMTCHLLRLSAMVTNG